MPLVKVCRPSDILSTQATVTLTSGTASTAFPLANAYDRLAHTVFKSVGTCCQIQFAFSSSVKLEAIALVHLKYSTGLSITLTNAAGLSQVIAVSTAPQDGIPIDPWKDLSALSNTSSTTWTLVVNGASTFIAFGEILFVETLRTLRVRWDVVEGEAHAAIVQETDYGVRNKYSLGVRQRMFSGRIFEHSEMANVVALQRDAAGQADNFLLVPDSTVNDALYVDLQDEARTFTRRFTGFTDADVRFVEQQKGLPL